MSDLPSKMHTEDSDEFFSETDINAEKELYAVVLKMKKRLTDLENNVINVYVDLILPAIKRRQRMLCPGCLNAHGRCSEHDCFEKPDRNFIGMCITEVG